MCFFPGDFEISRYKLCVQLLIYFHDLLIAPVNHSSQYISPFSFSLSREHRSLQGFSQILVLALDQGIICFWVKGVSISIMSNPPRIRKRVGADPSKFKRGVDGSGFITCEKCGFSVPAGAANVHDCKLDARIKSSLECHHTIDSAVRGHPQFRSRKHQRTEGVEIQKAPKCAKKPKDPNQPKKPQTVFFVFMEEFRKKYKEDNADAKGVNRQGADKWKSMTEEDKKPYFTKAHKLKMEYETAMAKYLEEVRQANEEADSAEVGIIDMAAEYSYEDYLYELEDSSYYTSDDYASEY